MFPAIDPNVDYKAVVWRGYDACAASYDESRSTEPGTELQGLTDRLNDGDAVLDIGWRQSPHRQVAGRTLPGHRGGHLAGDGPSGTAERADR